MTRCLCLLFCLAILPARADEPAVDRTWPPHWPVGFDLPDELAGKRPAKPEPFHDVMAWVPEGAKRIRSILLFPNNTDTVHLTEHPAIRRVAAEHEMGMVYLLQCDPGFEHRREAPAEPDRLQRVLDLVAEKTGVVEFRHAPWITIGKSSRGEFPFRAAWLYPGRTIATIDYHAETPTWPPLPWARLDGETILHVNVNGETEWGGTWFNHVRPSLLNYRAKQNWLAHQVVSKGVDHGNYPDGHGGGHFGEPFPGRVTVARVWDYLAVFLDRALELRVPRDPYPTDGPVTLKAVDESTGYLIDPFAVEVLLRMGRMPLTETPEGFAPNGPVAVSGYSEMSPLKGFAPKEGAPVVKPDPDVKGFKDWLVTDAVPAMKDDPMQELGDLVRLMPGPGDRAAVDGAPVTFRPVHPAEVSPQGGLLPPGAPTFLAYTVLEIPERRIVRLCASFTPGTRQQVVINGVPVRHQQVLDLQPGRYPLLTVVRMGIRWDRIGPWLEEATDEQVALGKAEQVAYEKRTAEEAQLKASGWPLPPALIRKAADVPEADRKKHFWVADREQAEAWFRLHAVHGQSPEIR